NKKIMRAPTTVSQFYVGCSQNDHTGGFPPAHGGTAIVNGEPFDAMFFENYGTNPFVDVEDDSLSTFAIDVDDASYIMSRSYLERGHLPPKDAIRSEEFINHFDYGYDAPTNKTFDFFIESAPSHFGQNSYLLKIGIKGREVRPENRKAANLVFVVDVSGSMARENRLSLVKKALRLLVDELNESDNVGIVVYGSTGRVILEPTSIKDKEKIITAIEMLHSGGSTFAEQGIRLGYEMADKYFDSEKINRVILCSDGVANVGRTGADDILRQIKTYAKKGITLSSVGFGMGNYNDILLEKLGNKGNGYYAYVDDINEARRIFVDNLTGTLEVIARDVKIQMEFDGKTVRNYRLLGYENRDVADKDFRNDDVDGGEVGSGHEVTALYEIKLTHAKVNAPLGKLHVRYKDPIDNEIYETNKEVPISITYSEFKDASENFKLSACAAEFAEILRESYWAKEATLADLKDVVKKLYANSESSDILELLSLIDKANELKQQRVEK
ncbi:MAG: von Willebrand factor type A domain-containing protein, partial [candidate division Zixibacteria bacterium]|nr:von Willebrand factor type A domain-containing protein [candidate division Zixibacteria bacterium]